LFRKALIFLLCWVEYDDTRLWYGEAFTEIHTELDLIHSKRRRIWGICHIGNYVWPVFETKLLNLKWKFICM
jgi:hypothetical protein